MHNITTAIVTWLILGAILALTYWLTGFIGLSFLAGMQVQSVISMYALKGKDYTKEHFSMYLSTFNPFHKG